MPGWVNRGAMDPTFSIDTRGVCDPRVWHQPETFLGAVLRSSHCRHLKCPVIVLGSPWVSLDHSHFAQDPVPGVQAWDASSKASLETSWLPQQSPGNFQLFLGSPFHRGPSHKPPPQLETSLVHTHVTSKTLVAPVELAQGPHIF